MNLIEEIRSGEKSAMKQLYSDYSGNVYDFSMEITGNHEDSLKAVKDTFNEVFERIKGGETPENLRLFVLKTAHEKAFDIAAQSLTGEPVSISKPNSVAINTDSYNPYKDSSESDSASQPIHDQTSDQNEEACSPTSVPHKNRALVTVLILINVVIFLILVWFVVGLLVKMDVIPYIDLGYSWFDQNICPLFFSS